MYKLDHPNVVRLYNHFEDNDNVYLLLDFAEKGQLFNLIKGGNRLSEKEAVVYIQGLVQALDYIHNFKEPIIHRDIKGENIL